MAILSFTDAIQAGQLEVNKPGPMVDNLCWIYMFYYVFWIFDILIISFLQLINFYCQWLAQIKLLQNNHNL